MHRRGKRVIRLIPYTTLRASVQFGDKKAGDAGLLRIVIAYMQWRLKWYKYEYPPIDKYVETIYNEKQIGEKMKIFPMRKRTSQVSRREKEFYIREDPERAKDIISGKFFEEEVDIPAHYNLEKKIIMELLEEVDWEDEYRLVESKRGLTFANKFREENKNSGVEYRLKKGSIIPIMKKFLTFVDELNNIFKTYSPCKKGCSFCCDIPLAVSDLEVILIKEYLDKNHIAYKRLNCMKEMPRNFKKGKIIGEKYEGIKCPFLKDNICSIYSVRPYRCRKHIVGGDMTCDLDEYNYFVDEGYIIGLTYEDIVAYHIRKNMKRYSSILDPEQISVTEEANLDNDVYNLMHWQMFSDIRDNFSDIDFV